MAIHIKDSYGTKNDENWFLVELRNKPKVLYIVDQKIIEMVICDDKSCFKFDDFTKSANSDSLGWHIGNDGKIYERHQMSEIGKYWYKINKIEKKKTNFMLALNEINKGINQDNLLDEKNTIIHNLRKNQIKTISKYEGQERKQNNSTNTKTPQENTREL